MRTVGYIPKEDMEQGKEPITEQGGTPAPPEPKANTGKKGKKGGKKE